MYILGIETSSGRGSLALASEGGMLEISAFSEDAAHARNIMPYVRDLLLKAGLDKGDINAVAVSAGPGSFTGLRVGVTCAKTLSFALGWKTVGVCSLEVLACNIDVRKAGCEYICPVRNARRGAVHGRIFRKSHAGWRPQGTVFTGAPGELADALGDKTMVFGSGLDAWPGVFGSPRFVHPEDNAQVSVGSAASVARLGLEYARAGAFIAPMELVPQYHRLTEIEERVN